VEHLHRNFLLFDHRAEIQVFIVIGNAQAELVGEGVVDEPFPVIDSAVCRDLFFRPDAVDRRRAASDEERDHAGEEEKKRDR